MELQQSPLYKHYIEHLHWTVETIDGINIFIKKFPLFGGFAKLQRIETFPDIDKLASIVKKYRIRKLVLEASHQIDEQQFKAYATTVASFVPLVQSPYIPTKTIRVDLTNTEKELFQHFSEAKRRAVRRALSHNITTFESDQFSQFIKVKNTSAGIFGFITTSGANELWKAFRPKHATILLAKTMNNEIVGGIFLVFWENTAYYWLAGATRKGKKLFAPTLLVWEALKVARTQGMKQFDFIGVWDERYPKDNRDWLGFTKFKEGFGGKPLYYPTHF